MNDLHKQPPIKVYGLETLPDSGLVVDLDWLGQQVQSLCTGSPATLIGHFRTYSAAKLNRIRQTAHQGDYLEYRKAVHDLRASTLNVGALDLHKYCLQVERLAFDRAMTQEVVNTIAERLERTLQVLDDYLAARTS